MTIVARLVSCLLTKLYVAKFSPSVYGIFTNLYSWAAMLNAVLAFGMETTYFRYLQKHDHDRAKVYNNSFTIILFTTALFVITMPLFSSTLATLLTTGRYHSAFIRTVRLFPCIPASFSLA